MSWTDNKRQRKGQPAYTDAIHGCHCSVSAAETACMPADMPVDGG